MILIGDELVPYEKIVFICKIEDILQTSADVTLVFEYNQEIMDYCFKNQLTYAVITKDLKEAIYANALEAKYIICKKQIATDIQQTADNYMFDSKVLCIIESNDEFVEVIKNQIDGVIYKALLK